MERDLQCGSLDEWTGDVLREDFSADAVAFSTFVPALPARLEEVGGREKGVVSEGSRDGSEVWLLVFSKEVVYFSGKVGKGIVVVYSSSKLVCCK